MSLEYNDFPLVHQWSRDLSKHKVSIDNSLKYCAEILNSVHLSTDRGVKICRLSDLYFGLNYWMIRSRNRAKGTAYKHPEPVNALFRLTVFSLCDVFGCTVNVLPRELEDYFGKRLSDHGVKGDMDQGLAKYLSRAEAKKYKIVFKEGKAYQLPWWNKGTNTNLKGATFEPASTDPSRILKDASWPAGHGGYAMSMSREIYMGNHSGGNKERNKHANFFHSSYLAGDPVLCAGTIKIEGGIIKEVSNLSGHYKPSALHLLNVLKCMKMNDVKTDNVKFLLYLVNEKKGAFKKDTADFWGFELEREFDTISKIYELWTKNWRSISNDVNKRMLDKKIHNAYATIKRSGMDVQLGALAKMAGVKKVSIDKFQEIIKRFGSVESPSKKSSFARLFQS